jgi:hypothetical protein
VKEVEPSDPEVRNLVTAMTDLQDLCRQLAPKVQVALISAQTMESIIKTTEQGKVSQAAEIFGNEIYNYSEQEKAKEDSDETWIKAMKDCLSKAYPVGMFLLGLTSFAVEVHRVLKIALTHQVAQFTPLTIAVNAIKVSLEVYLR